MLWALPQTVKRNVRSRLPGAIRKELGDATPGGAADDERQCVANLPGRSGI
jgi:hypothetical protein